MKSALAILTVLGLIGSYLVKCSPPNDEIINSRTRGIADDLLDFVNIIPLKKITDLFNQYLNNDENFEDAVMYILFNEEFKGFVIEIESMTEAKDILNYLQKAGLNAYEYVNKINGYLYIQTISSSFKLTKVSRASGLGGFINDVKDLIPTDEIKNLYDEKMKSSEEFSALIKKLNSPEFKSLVDKIMGKPRLQEILKKLKSNNIDLQEIFDVLITVLGLKFPKSA